MMKRILFFAGCFLSIMGLLVSCHSANHTLFLFETYEAGLSGTLRGLDVVDQETVWISGTGGAFSMTTDGGENWFSGQVSGAAGLDFRDVHGFSADEALLMSAGPGELSRIYHTTDGGQHWDLTFTNPDSAGFFDGFDFLNRKEGVLFSDPIDSKLNILVTNDGGMSWTRFHPELVPMIQTGEYAFAASGTSIRFDPSGGIWLATGGSVARIWHTPALGKSWTQWETPSIQGDAAEGLFSIAPRSAIRVVAVGGNYLKMDLTGSNVVRQNRVGAITWDAPEGAANVPFLECVRWISNYALLACGPPGVWMSGDNGSTWKEISAEQGFHTLDVDEKSRSAWLAGSQGQVSRLSW